MGPPDVCIFLYFKKRNYLTVYVSYICILRHLLQKHDSAPQKNPGVKLFVQT